MNTTITSAAHGGTSNTASSRSGKQGLARALAIVLLITTFAALNAGAADALTTTGTGSPGTAVFQRVGGQHVTGSWGTTSGLRIQGPYVTRSRASTDTQIVWFQAIVEQYYGGRWVTVWNSGMTGTYLAPGQERYLETRFAPVGRGHFRVTEHVYWQDSRNRNLGGVGASFDRGGDYFCSIASCAVNAGYISL